MEKLLEKYLPGYQATEETNEARGAVQLQRRHFEWLIDLLAGTLEAINASNINKKKAIEVFAQGLNGTNSNFNRERFIRTAYKKILTDEAAGAPKPDMDVDMERQRGLGESETLDEKKKKKQPMKKCTECGADMPAFFNKCPKCDAAQKEKTPEEGVKADDKKEMKK